METLDHRALRQAAIGWLLSQSCTAVAHEVTTAVPRWRVDAAGWRRAGLDCQTVIIECKQSRSDFLRDDASTDALVDERTRLRQRRIAIEETRVKIYEPHLRTAEAQLFEEASTWDFTRSKLADYRRILCALRRVDSAIHGETKFCLLARYRLADRLYLLCPQGMIRKREVPEGWGLLECPRAIARRSARASEVPLSSIRCTVEAPALLSRSDRRERLLRNIAVAATRSAFGHLMPPREDGQRQERPHSEKKGLLF